MERNMSPESRDILSGRGGLGLRQERTTGMSFSIWRLAQGFEDILSDDNLVKALPLFFRTSAEARQCRDEASAEKSGMGAR
jgi:hypothetical protein